MPRGRAFHNRVSPDVEDAMLDFLFRNRRDEVSQILSARMNRAFGRQIGPRDRRHCRSGIWEVVWVVGYDSSTDEPDFDRVFAAISRDISPLGLSIIHTRPIEEERVLVGLESNFDTAFIRSKVEHCSGLGYGFFHIGLNPEKKVHVDRHQVVALRRRLEGSSEPTMHA